MVRTARMVSDPPPFPPPLTRLLEVYEVAYQLKSSQEHVRRLIRDGKLHAIRLGTRSWRIDPADLQTFLDRQRVGDGRA
jgi:excisionase family DNA binding protein